MKKRLFAFIVTPMLILSACARDNQPKEIDYHSLVFNYPALELEIGKSQTLKVKSGMPDENSVITWVTSDKNVATVTKAGLVYAYKEGTCTITGFIDANSNGQLDEKEYYGECQVTDFLKDKGLNFSVSDKELDLQMEQTRYVSAYIKPAPESGNYYYLTYTVEDPSIAKVTKDSSYNTRALVKAIGLGSTDVTVTYGGQTAIFTINVTPWIEGDKTHVASIAFSEDTKVIQKTSEANPTYQTAVEILPSTATNKKISYSSNNPDVATVDENGVVTGLTGGSAIITAVSEDLQKTASMNIVVQDIFTTYETDLYAGYYNGLTTWKNGEDLIDKLHDIIRDYTPLKYDWDVVRSADEAIDNASALDAMYSAEEILKSEQSNGYNREHAFPASLMTGFSTGEATTQKGRATDYHNLYAAGKSGNSARNNKNYGMADVNEPSYSQSEEGYSSDRLNFEPNDYDKGKASRALFYMATMYNEDVIADVTDSLTFQDDDPNKTGGSKSVHVVYTQKALQIREEYADYSKITFSKFHYHEDDASQAIYEQYVTQDTTDLSFEDLLAVEAEAYGEYSTDNCEFAIGGLSDLLSWSSYGISYAEYRRNNVVEDAQGNRNPFTDYPELINYAYGALKDQPGSLENIRPSEEILDTDSGETIAYRVESYKESAVVDTTYTAEDINLVAVKSDLSTEPAPEGANLFDSYTFTKADLENSFAYLTIPTTLNTIKIKVKVTEGDISICNYQHELTGNSKGGDMKDFTSGNTVTLSEIEWKISWTNASDTDCNPGNKRKAGVAFGKTNHGVGSITFETTESIENLSAIFILANCASNKTVTYKLYAGATVVKSGSYTGTGQDSDPILIGTTFEAKTSVAKIVISGASDFAVHMHTLALKY